MGKTIVSGYGKPPQISHYYLSYFFRLNFQYSPKSGRLNAQISKIVPPYPMWGKVGQAHVFKKKGPLRSPIEHLPIGYGRGDKL